MTYQTITNADDLIDSRDIIARIAELEAERDERDGEEYEAWQASEDADELAALCNLRDEASQYAADWEYGETLIRDSYFAEYAQQLAGDIGAIIPPASWPLTYIDWDAAADALKQDYIQVDFDGITYWIR